MPWQSVLGEVVESSHPCWSSPRPQRPKGPDSIADAGWAVVASIGPALGSIQAKSWRRGRARRDGALVLMRRAGLDPLIVCRPAFPPSAHRGVAGLERKDCSHRGHPRDWPEIRSVTRPWTLCACCSVAVRAVVDGMPARVRGLEAGVPSVDRQVARARWHQSVQRPAPPWPGRHHPQLPAPQQHPCAPGALSDSHLLM